MKVKAFESSSSFATVKEFGENLLGLFPEDRNVIKYSEVLPENEREEAEFENFLKYYSQKKKLYVVNDHKLTGVCLKLDTHWLYVCIKPDGSWLMLRQNRIIQEHESI